MLNINAQNNMNYTILALSKIWMNKSYNVVMYSLGSRVTFYEFLNADNSFNYEELNSYVMENNIEMISIESNTNEYVEIYADTIQESIAAQNCDIYITLYSGDRIIL